jgi:hypothetical protein
LAKNWITDQQAAFLFKAYTMLGDTADAVKYYQGGLCPAQ